VRLALAALVAGLAAGCGASSKCGPATGVVVNVIDGDTIDLESGVKVRLLLVDTPEITKGKNDCYGHEAAAVTSARVSGKTVELAYDEASCTDRYGRTLAYVKADGVELNRELITQGYACFLYVAPGGGARQDEFATYEAEARTNRVGMWGSCTVIPCAK
jgi:micrococcal nuclease